MHVAVDHAPLWLRGFESLPAHKIYSAPKMGALVYSRGIRMGKGLGKNNFVGYSILGYSSLFAASDVDRVLLIKKRRTIAMAISQ